MGMIYDQSQVLGVGFSMIKEASEIGVLIYTQPHIKRA